MIRLAGFTSVDGLVHILRVDAFSYQSVVEQVKVRHANGPLTEWGWEFHLISISKDALQNYRSLICSLKGCPCLDCPWISVVFPAIFARRLEKMTLQWGCNCEHAGMVVQLIHRAWDGYSHDVRFFGGEKSLTWIVKEVHNGGKRFSENPSLHAKEEIIDTILNTVLFRFHNTVHAFFTSLADQIIRLWKLANYACLHVAVFQRLASVAISVRCDHIGWLDMHCACEIWLIL